MVGIKIKVIQASNNTISNEAEKYIYISNAMNFIEIEGSFIKLMST